MKFVEILSEAKVASKAIVDAILKNSGYHDITPEQRAELVQKINTVFPIWDNIKNGIRLNSPQVKTFLLHFDGNHGTKKYMGNVENNDLKNPFTYTLTQMEFITDEYQTKDLTPTENAELITKSEYDDKLAEVSKKLWYDPSKAVINLPGFRVYQPKNQMDAVKYGWYEEKMMNEIRPGWHSWCITWRKKTNRWGVYRGDGGTFYFVIDESKLNSENIDEKKYYLSAIQVIDRSVDSNHPTGYEITDIRNPGEDNMTWEQLVKIYPQLSEYRNVISPVPFSSDEVEMKSVVGEMNENPSSQYYFPRMERKYKRAYIESLLQLKTAASWWSMDEKLQASYITLTPSKDDFVKRFATFEFLRAVKQTGQIKLLDGEMKSKGINEGVSFLTAKLMKDMHPKKQRQGIINDKIQLFKVYDTNYGLWDDTTLDWLTRNNDEYSPSYRKVESEIIRNPDTKDTFYYDKYEAADGDYFVSITPIPDVDSYFLSKSKWESIKDKFEENPNEKLIYKSQDINEE